MSIYTIYKAGRAWRGNTDLIYYVISNEKPFKKIEDVYSDVINIAKNSFAVNAGSVIDTVQNGNIASYIVKENNYTIAKVIDSPSFSGKNSKEKMIDLVLMKAFFNFERNSSLEYRPMIYTKGYMVSTTKSAIFNKDDIEGMFKYLNDIETNIDILSKIFHDIRLGFYYPTENTIAIDISLKVDTKEEATFIKNMFNQNSIYDISTGELI